MRAMQLSQVISFAAACSARLTHFFLISAAAQEHEPAADEHEAGLSLHP